MAGTFHKELRILTTYTGPGVYVIRCVVNGKVYIGSSIDVRRRLKNHLCLLRKGIHGNRHLQSAWNQLSERAFRFDLLEKCIPDQRVLVETRWIQHYNALNDQHGFNFENPEDPSSRCARHWVVTNPQGVESVIENLHGFCRKHGMNSASMVAVAQGRSLYHHRWLCRHSEQTKSEWEAMRQRLSEKCAKTGNYKGEYLLYSPEGVEYRVLHLPSFCEAHGINYSGIHQVIRGVAKSSQGWFGTRAGAPRKRPIDPVRWIVQLPDGSKQYLTELKPFLLASGFSVQAAYQAIYRNRPYHDQTFTKLNREEVAS